MIERRPWSHQARAELDRAMGRDAGILEDQVRRGVAQLWRVEHRGAAGWVVTRVEDTGDGREVVLCAGEGRGLLGVMEAAEEIARKSGFRTLRAHIRKPGMLRLYKRAGFEVSELVMRKVIE